MDFGIVGVAGITVLCYLIAHVVKVTPLDHKWLPVLCGLMGGICGVVALYIGMDGFPATDPLTAAAVGVVSGLAATGANQIGKQLTQ